MKISKIVTAFAVTCYAAAIGHDERGARPDRIAVKCPKGGRPDIGGLCIDEIEPIGQIDLFDDKSGHSLDPLEGKRNMLNPQNSLPNPPEIQTTTKLPTITEKMSVEGIIPIDNLDLLNTDGGGDSLDGERNLIDSLNELPKLISTEAPTNALTFTTKKPATTTKTNVATGAMNPIDARTVINTDEEYTSNHEELESQESAEENAAWWIWPVICVSVGTILLGVSIYTCLKRGAGCMPTEYAPGETIIATESSDNKYGKTKDQFKDITQNTSIDQIQLVKITQQTV